MRFRIVPWLLFSVLTAFHASAQTYPAKPIRIIVSYPAGGANDIVARSVGQKLNELFGASIVIDNRSGAGGTIGADVAAKAPADGYTLLMAAGAHTLAPSLYIKLPYDIARDFAPISISAKSTYLLVVHPSVPARSVKELIALARAKPGGLNYASSGIGAPPHLAGEMFNTLAGVRMVHVAYKGDTPAIADLLGGHVDLAFLAISATSPHIKAGKLNALAVTSAQRTPVMPDLPTIAEAGGLKDFDISTWWGLLAPAGTASDVVNRLAAAMAKIAAMPDVKARFGELGVEAAANTPEQFSAFIKAEIQKFAALAKLAGIKPE
ncbi:MAG TPA: tripartite tricarboxylate transporter substrate binding protein [Burkholderiales bacterium]|nr:tripartite tricarboxylate transporter substrate binding protein [Burkholderiales bacterium]